MLLIRREHRIPSPSSLSSLIPPLISASSSFMVETSSDVFELIVLYSLKYRHVEDCGRPSQDPTSQR